MLYLAVPATGTVTMRSIFRQMFGHHLHRIGGHHDTPASEEPLVRGAIDKLGYDETWLTWCVVRDPVSWFLSMHGKGFRGEGPPLDVAAAQRLELDKRFFSSPHDRVLHVNHTRHANVVTPYERLVPEARRILGEVFGQDPFEEHPFPWKNKAPSKVAYTEEGLLYVLKKYSRPHANLGCTRSQEHVSFLSTGDLDKIAPLTQQTTP